jgi:hypothetical protein
MSSDMFTLKFKEFSNNAASSFQALFKDTNFTDVTLASSDGQRVGAHKVVLSSCSPVFKWMLVKNSHPNPLLYLRGVKLSQLETLLTFCYQGQAEVLQEELEEFLEVARDLAIRGLSQEDTQIQNHEHVQENRSQRNNKTSSVSKCKFWNRGYCKERIKCLRSHPYKDCQHYMETGRCRYFDCPYRHRRVCSYWLGEGCTRKKYCQYLHRDVGEEYDSYVSSRSSDRDHCSASPCQQNETEENKNDITTDVVSDLESTFDYGLLNISEDIVEEVREKTSVRSKKTVSV